MSGTELFGTDGVRGIAGRYPLEPKLVRKLGAAAAWVYRQNHSKRKPYFLLGRDTRASGHWLARAFAEGAASEGVAIHDLGVVSTPAVAYLAGIEKGLGGVMISASHNPAEFNGIKLFNPVGRKCPDAWERWIEERVAAMPERPPRRTALQKSQRVVAHYLDFVKKTLPGRAALKGMHLVVDCSNGSLSKIAPAFLRQLGLHVTPLGASPNGRNINQNVGSQHPQRLQKEVVRRKADGGLAFDGDADRVVFCDESGRLLDGDFVLAAASYFLKEEKRLKANTVVVTVMANLGLLQTLHRWGLRIVSTPVGDRFVSDMLDRHGASIGGEQSGHIIFHDHLPTGDGLLTGLQVLSRLRQRKLPMSFMATLMQKFPQVLVNVQVKQKKPIEQCAELAREIRRAEQVLANQGRVVVRYSGTEPLLRIMMEGPREDELKSLAARISDCAKAELR